MTDSRPTPSEPAGQAGTGRRELLKRVWREIREDDITGQAAKLAYFAFLAMPPALMAVFGVAGLFGSEAIAAWVERQARVAMPQAVTEEIVVPFIQQVVLENAPGPLSIGLLLAVWGASAVFSGTMDSLNIAYDIDDDRPFLKRRAMAVGVMIVGVILFLLAAGALLLGPQVADALGLGSVGRRVWDILQWPLAFAFVVSAFWIAYYVLPNRDQRGCRVVILKAAAAAAVLWLLATLAFRIYISNFSSYTETYGFLGAFIILLLWLYVTALVVLAGGELASEMEDRSRARS